jgi:hypothetical protein
MTQRHTSSERTTPVKARQLFVTAGVALIVVIGYQMWAAKTGR